MPVLTESSEHMKWRRPRSQLIQPISETDPYNPNPAPSIIQSTRCKSTISSLLLSSFTTTTTTNEASSSSLSTKKKTNFPSSAKFRGMGCTASASQQVSVPAVIRSSADWEGKKVKKKKVNKKNVRNEFKDKSQNQGVVDGPVGFGLNSATCMDFQDVWCGPGIGFSAETAGSVDCVVARRNVSGRGKIDGDHNRMNSHRERPCLARRTVNPDTISFLDSEPEFLLSRPGSEVFGSRCYRHVRHASPEGLAEIMMFQSSLMMGGRSDMDRYREWRLDVDNMTYEELLELGERIGYVSTGLKEDEISRCLRKIKLSMLSDRSQHSPGQIDGKCIICQEEYEADDEMGRLNCGHLFHLQCIEQWLAHKNTCPFCKVEATTKR
ncbi:uncharacterized protein LOC133742830 isoform X2 [Rosa rugosa]|uniref:uncharacterized protein LOC133742830 isoform X2 n=1 Tax=Rosa rugosa TaxID=74645 RepID=UPI002B40AF50|nr:uncharacterized protein LOC133742830 isoform X2 [Rosa rugosa]